MADTALLEKYIAQSGYKKTYIAQTMGISRCTLNNKINNVTEFKASEIDALCRIIGLDDPQTKEEIFFTL